MKKNISLLMIATMTITLTGSNLALAKDIEDMNCRELRAELRHMEQLKEEVYDEAGLSAFLGAVTGDRELEDGADNAELVGALIEFEIDDIEDEMDAKRC